MTEAAEVDDTAIPHPRENPQLLGHENAERELIEATGSGRLAHAWLLTGPRGIGKATLAYRFARYLLSAAGGIDLFGNESANSLYVAPDSDVFRRLATGSHGEVMTIERSPDPKTRKMRNAIVVGDIRRLQGFFGLTAAEGGWRIAIIDSADEMNRNAANALLKILEEPPKRGILLLTAHAPGRLAPTIRSRCRRIALRPLAADQVAEVMALHRPELAASDRELIAGLAEGSPGRALVLAAEGGVSLYRDLEALLDPLPDLDVAAVYELADRLVRSDQGFRLFAELIEGWLARTIKARATGEGGNSPGDGRAIEPWTGAWDKIIHLIERTTAVNLDQRQVVVSIFTRLQATARASGG